MNNDTQKTKEELINELVELRQQIVKLAEIIAGQKAVEQALIESEVRYRRLFETAQDGILILDADTGQIVDVNPFLTRLLGYSCDELLGKTLWEIGSFEDIKVSQSAFQELQRKEFIRYANLPLETKYGHPIEVEFVSNIYLVDSKKVIQCNIRDNSERKLAEEKVQELADLLNKTQDAIIVRDLEDRILFCNKSAVHLYGLIREPEELTGKTTEELLYKEYASEIEEAKQTVIERGEWSGELHQVTKDGKEVIVESRWTMVYDDKGKPKSILTINTDITEKRKIQAQFLRAQRMESIGVLAGGIAHDLNNVLAPIMMALQLLRQKSLDKQSLGWIDTLETSAQRGANLVKQVLSFARGLEGELAILQVRHLIYEIGKVIKETFPRLIEVRIDIPKDLWLISGDITQLHQVLMNLCINARDAMPNGGILSISAENLFIDENYAKMNVDARVGWYVVITISDTGTGIPPEIVDRIFEPFFTTKEIGKGTGFGLSTAFGIVKGHGGFIHLYSEVGKGTQFKVYLPAVETTETQKAKEKQVELHMGHGELVLVVDDEASIREITRVTLETYGYRVITASDGTEAIDLYKQKREEIKVVLIDMMMPIMGGLETIREIRKINLEVKVIAASGLTESEKFAELTSTEVQSFLSKPYTAGTLLNTIHEVLIDTRW